MFVYNIYILFSFFYIEQKCFLLPTETCLNGRDYFLPHTTSNIVYCLYHYIPLRVGCALTGLHWHTQCEGSV